MHLQILNYVVSYPGCTYLSKNNTRIKRSVLKSVVILHRNMFVLRALGLYSELRNFKTCLAFK